MFQDCVQDYATMLNIPVRYAVQRLLPHYDEAKLRGLMGEDACHYAIRGSMRETDYAIMNNPQFYGFPARNDAYPHPPLMKKR